MSSCVMAPPRMCARPGPATSAPCGASSASSPSARGGSGSSARRATSTRWRAGRPVTTPWAAARWWRRAARPATSSRRPGTCPAQPARPGGVRRRRAAPRRAQAGRGCEVGAVRGGQSGRGLAHRGAARRQRQHRRRAVPPRRCHPRRHDGRAVRRAGLLAHQPLPAGDEFRGAPPADVAAVADVVVRTSGLAAAHPAVVELDLNPVIASPAGAVVVDARIRVEEPPPAAPFPAVGA